MTQFISLRPGFGCIETGQVWGTSDIQLPGIRNNVTLLHSNAYDFLSLFGWVSSAFVLIMAVNATEATCRMTLLLYSLKSINLYLTI